MTKAIITSEDIADYSKIAGQGTIKKTGDGALQIIAAAEGLVRAKSFVVSSGRPDMAGYFEGSLMVANDTIDIEEVATFSPGISVGTINIDGDLLLADNAVLLMEIAGTTFDMNDQLILNGQLAFEEGAIVQFALAADSEYTPIIGNRIAVNMPKVDWTTATFMSDDFELHDFDDLAGLQYLMPKVNPSPNPLPDTKGDTGAAPVPEPSTWALLILGVAGLMYVRKRVKN